MFRGTCWKGPPFHHSRRMSRHAACPKERAILARSQERRKRGTGMGDGPPPPRADPSSQSKIADAPMVADQVRLIQPPAVVFFFCRRSHRSVRDAPDRFVAWPAHGTCLLVDPRMYRTLREPVTYTHAPDGAYARTGNGARVEIGFTFIDESQTAWPPIYRRRRPAAAGPSTGSRRLGSTRSTRPSAAAGPRTATCASSPA